MPPETNFYAFCADYSDMATCLFAIQDLSDSGALSGYPALQQQLRVFEQNTLVKLYVRAVAILNKTDFDSDLVGDFSSIDFNSDFFLNYLDPTNTGFSSLFQTILNILQELERETDLISVTDITNLDASLVEVIDAFGAIQAYLTAEGLNPCVPQRTLYLNNSTDVYLQAAGADGSDGVPEGIHLRWSLAGELGLNHLPKGDFDNAISVPALFNQPNDYIRIFRTPYDSTVPFSIDFQLISPSVNYSLKRWTYFINQTVNGKVLTNRLTLTFADPNLYNQLAATINPAADHFGFLKDYPGVIQLAIANKSIYRIGFDFVNGSASGPATLKIEAQCVADVSDPAAETVYARKTVTAGAASAIPVTLFGENIQSVRILMSAGAFLQTFSFETYNDFLVTRNDNDWKEVGSGFGLTLTNNEVFERLETAAYPVDDRWPQYNEGTTVRVANYQDKWGTDHTDDPAIKQVVTNYLSLSETDPRAMMVLDDQSAYPDPSGFQISLVDMLNLAASDFHIARMLGLGCIDVTTAVITAPFIYRLAYTNQSGLQNTTPLARFYMTLPTSKADNLLPLQPQMRPVKYGLPVEGNSASSAFDAEGYEQSGDVRAVNIGRQLYNDEIPGYDFFADLNEADNTNIFTNSRPVSYGIKYRPAAQSGYTKPEITQNKSFGVEYNAYDPDFPETGIPETVPVPDNETSLYVHLEHHTGVHYYAIYGINWFSRSSVISGEVSTDDTEFPLQNRLQPPTDVAVQYIQQEEPLLFTTSQEQVWLAGRAASFPGADINFTRIVFNWLDIIDISTLPDTSPSSLAKAIRPDTVHVFFDPGLPVEVQGMIQNIAPVPGYDDQLLLYTAPYTQIDGTVLSPAIDGSAFFRFDNSLLNTPQGRFVVVNISQGITWPVITVKKIVQHTAQEDTQQQGNYGLVQTYQSPLINSRFSMVENLSNAANWQPVAEGIALYSFADAAHPVIESFTDSEGNITQNWIGGITADAEITPLFSDQELPSDLPGYYQLQFSAALVPNPQINIPFDPGNPDNNAPGALHTAHVEWYKGWCRINSAAGGDKKQLEVLRIVQADPLLLIIYDPAYLDDPIPVSSSGNASIPVNFHPGYRAYAFPEPAPHTFNGSNILPSGNQNNLKTMIGLQAADTRPGGSGFSSSVSSPAILLARLIVQPVQFAPPSATSYVVRPNATAKAAFTFDVTVAPAADGSARNPFGFKFCRTSEEDVLYALYESSTVDQIRASLAALTDDPGYNQRYFELVNLIMDPVHPGLFRVFDATPNPYGFPVPDKSGLADPDPVDVLIQKYSLAIQGTILPLTATTPIFSFIKTGLQTDNSQPAIRDINGQLLDPSSPSFNPFPMIRQYTKSAVPNTTYIRFTDYTLTASSRSLYFYAAAEVTNQLVAGPLSQFTGPVTILNTTPPEAPIIRTFSIVPSAPGVTSPISIMFQVLPTAPYDNITAMRFYRTTAITLANALMTMGTPVEVAVSDPDQLGYTLTDNLSDMTNIPFGELIYYRIASVRSIINEFNLPEDVVSIGSDVATINLIDTVNPTAPQLAYASAGNALSWTTVVNKGTYYLYQQNARGNWTLLYTDRTPQTGRPVEFTLPQPLVRIDSNGNAVYNRFKVRVQNSSGLFNLTDNILTV